MAKMMAMICNLVAGRVVRWVGAIVIAAGISARSMMAQIGRVARALASTGVVPPVRQQFLDTAVELGGPPTTASYRMRQVGTVAAGTPGTTHNGAAGESDAWLRAIDNDRHTPIMRNLAPWIVRIMAVPAVAVYCWRLLRANRVDDVQVPALRLAPCFEAIDDGFADKVRAMQLYTSQFREFYHSGEDCANALRNYAAIIAPGKPCERRWKVSS